MPVWFPFFVLLLVSCITDFFYRKISNMLLLVIGTYGLIASLFEMGNLVFIDSVLGLIIGLLIVSVAAQRLKLPDRPVSTVT